MARTLIAMALAVAVAAPATAQDGSVKTITMTGLVTSEGAECPAVRGPDGQLYSLAGRDLDLVPGDVVQIRGSLAEASTCNQGRTITVASIEQIHSAGDRVGLTVDGALRRGGEMLRRGAAFVGEKAHELGQAIDRSIGEDRR
jgi:hypothetical protein